MLNPPAYSPSLEKYLRLRQLIQGGYVPFAPATVWRKVADKSFPQPVRLSAGVTAWREKDVLDWQRRQAQGAKLQ